MLIPGSYGTQLLEVKGAGCRLDEGEIVVGPVQGVLQGFLVGAIWAAGLGQSMQAKLSIGFRHHRVDRGKSQGIGAGCTGRVDQGGAVHEAMDYIQFHGGKLGGEHVSHVGGFG